MELFLESIIRNLSVIDIVIHLCLLGKSHTTQLAQEQGLTESKMSRGGVAS